MSAERSPKKKVLAEELLRRIEFDGATAEDVPALVAEVRALRARVAVLGTKMVEVTITEKSALPASFAVEGHPVAKARPRVVNGHAYTPLATRAAEEAMGWAAKAAGVSVGNSPCKVTLRAYFAIPRSWPKRWQLDALAGTLRPTGKPDADNLLKLCLDGGNRIVWEDDSQIVEAHVEKWYSDRPRTEITVEVI